MPTGDADRSRGAAMAGGARGYLTWSNGLTSLRLVAAPFFYYALTTHAWREAFVLFWFAVVTDSLDGRIARARGESSALGGLLDHGSDACFVVLGLLAVASAGQVPRALPFLVAAAFVQYVLDSKTLAGRPLRASRLGRWNGILYFVPLGIVVTRAQFSLEFPADSLVLLLGWALVLSTLFSICDRGWALIASRRSSTTAP
jgi:CDP-diacylglycerol--glycerol-3-phosphate 3-phosphatidyltransferase